MHCAAATYDQLGVAGDEVVRYGHDLGARDTQADRVGDAGREPFVGQHPGMLRVVEEFDDVVAVVIGADQVRLRSAPHEANVLHGVNHGFSSLREARGLIMAGSEHVPETRCPSGSRRVYKTLSEPATARELYLRGNCAKRASRWSCGKD